jgi:hypothetical protein
LAKLLSFCATFGATLQEAKMSNDARKSSDLRTITGLTTEVYTSALQYFAPVVAIYKVFESTAGITSTLPWWQKKEIDKDQSQRRGS